ncbi:MAG: alpha/beta fold hydrolase [Betaproteobacteria bacterium]|nr:alpha/beta fold hydrolase [Betaproteobacteria bacterium]
MVARKAQTNKSSTVLKQKRAAPATASVSGGTAAASTSSAWDELRAPNALLLALESRAPLELGVTLATWPLLKSAPAGDGHAVIVFPGLGAGDFSTVPLRNFLAAQGYETFGWDLGFNFGPREGVIEKSIDRIAEIRKSSGRRVSLIGWSLGGVYAREFAKALPDEVRSVITLGTPFGGDPKLTNAWRFYEFASGHKLDDPKLLHHLKEAPPVPTTSIFSRSDGIVAWPLSYQRESLRAENIEVVASHVGIGLHPAALYAVADRLSQAEGGWKKFDRSGWREWFYRDHTRGAEQYF